MAFSQQDLDLYKSQYPDDMNIQSLTLSQVNVEAAVTIVDYNTVPPYTDFVPLKRSILTPCTMSIGCVIFDAICLALGAVGLRSSIKPSGIAAVVEAATPALSKIEQIVARIGAPNASKWDWAKGLFDIVLSIYSADCLGAVISAFFGSLDWWAGVLYGITAIATIVAIFATEGLAFIAEVVVLLATFGFFVTDLYSAIKECLLTPEPLPSPGVAPFTLPDKFGGIRTYNNNFLTAVRNGGLGVPGNPVNTNRTQVGIWEKFTLIPVDAKKSSFALKTVAGGFLTAINGGGVKGPDNDYCPVHSNATKVGDWERFRFIKQSDESYAICTSNGYYLTAEYGGGQGPGSSTQALRTDIDQIGGFEVFKFAV